MRVPRSQASEALNDLAHGATLDEIRAMSSQVTLRFLRRRSDGSLSYLDLIFACDAYVCTDEKAEAKADFFEGRSNFLRSVYKLTGFSISGVSLDESGRVLIRFYDSCEVIFLHSEEDDDDGDWVWKFRFESGFAKGSTIDVSGVFDNDEYGYVINEVEVPSRGP